MAKKRNKKVYYHGTSFDNVDSIDENGLISQFEGIYLTDSADSACRWIGFRLKAGNTPDPIVAVVAVEMFEDELEPGTDHSPIMVQLFGVGASFLGPQKIDKSRIKGWEFFKIQSASTSAGTAVKKDKE